MTEMLILGAILFVVLWVVGDLFADRREPTYMYIEAPRRPASGCGPVIAFIVGAFAALVLVAAVAAG